MSPSSKRTWIKLIVLLWILSYVYHINKCKVFSMSHPSIQTVIITSLPLPGSPTFVTFVGWGRRMLVQQMWYKDLHRELDLHPSLLPHSCFLRQNWTLVPVRMGRQNNCNFPLWTMNLKQNYYINHHNFRRNGLIYQIREHFITYFPNLLISLYL